jgi:hypothetical protein
MKLADKDYVGAAQHVLPPTGARTSPPPRKPPTPPTPSCAPHERANAQLKTWATLHRLRSCPWHAGQIAKAIHVLQAREIAG